MRDTPSPTRPSGLDGERETIPAYSALNAGFTRDSFLLIRTPREARGARESRIYRDGSRIVPEYPGSKLLIRRRRVELARPPNKNGGLSHIRLAMSRIVSYAKTFERRTTLAR